jgi:hypothetical protein
LKFSLPGHACNDEAVKFVGKIFGFEKKTFLDENSEKGNSKR